MQTILKDVFPFAFSEAMDEFAGRKASSLNTDERARMVNRIVRDISEHEVLRPGGRDRPSSRKRRSPLGKLMPFLASHPDQSIDTSELSTRAAHVLQSARIVVWQDVLARCPVDFMRIRSAGPKTLREILGYFAERSLVVAARPTFRPVADVGGPSPKADPLSAREVACGTFFRHLGLVASWAVREQGLKTLGDVWTISRKLRGMPDEVTATLQRLHHMPLLELADPDLSGSSLADLLPELVADPRPNCRLVLQLRILNSPGASLLEAGRRLGVSRERARQLHVLAEARLNSLVNANRFFLVRWRADQLRGMLGVTAPADPGITSPIIDRVLHDVRDDFRPQFRGLILHLAGPYSVRAGWLVLKDAPVIDPAELAKQADESGLMTLLSAREWLYAHGISETFHRSWLENSGFRIIRNSVLVWTGSLLDKCVALLAQARKPVAIDTLLDLVGEEHSVKATKVRFSKDKRLVRVPLGRWGLRSWGLKEWKG